MSVVKVEISCPSQIISNQALFYCNERVLATI
jgi:hypothetical protein